MYYIQPSLALSNMLVGREEELYTHLRGAFSVARFDILGNAKALTRGTSDRTGSTLEPESHFAFIDNQYVTGGRLVS